MIFIGVKDVINILNANQDKLIKMTMDVYDISYFVDGGDLYIELKNNNPNIQQNLDVDFFNKEIHRIITYLIDEGFLDSQIKDNRGQIHGVFSGPEDDSVLADILPKPPERPFLSKILDLISGFFEPIISGL